MEKISNMIEEIKKNSYIRILIELVIGTLLFNVNEIIGIIFVLIMAFEIIFSDIENCLCIYIFLSFFDEVLQIQWLGGSISRIIMAVIAIKLIINIIKNRIVPSKAEIGISIFFIFSFLIGIFTYNTIKSEVIIILANIFMFILFSMNINIKDSEKIDIIIEKILVTIVLAVLNSIVYGLLTNAFLQEIDGENIVYRFKGTYEPNFMSLFINLGVIATLSLKNKSMNKNLAIVLCAIMINANIMAVSVTGLCTLALIILLYLILNRKDLKQEMIDLIVILLVSFIIFGGIQIQKDIMKKSERESQGENNIVEVVDNQIENNLDVQRQEYTATVEEYNNEFNDNSETGEDTNKKSDLQKRIDFLNEVVGKKDWDRFTSGRLPLIKTFIEASFNRPIVNVLFGNDATTKKVFSNYFYNEKYSHNSYIDILYNFGIVGFIIVIIYICRITVKNIFLKNNLNNSKYKNAIKLNRIMILIFAFALSLYTKRMVLLFFLL